MQNAVCGHDAVVIRVMKYVTKVGTVVWISAHVSFPFIFLTSEQLS